MCRPSSAMPRCIRRSTGRLRKHSALSSQYSAKPRKRAKALRPIQPSLLCILLRAHQMNRHVWLVADDPAVVPGGNIEDVAGSQFFNCAILHGKARSSGDNDADMFNHAELRAARFADVFRPAPTRLVSRATDGHAVDMHDFEFSFFERHGFVWLVETLEDDIQHGSSPRNPK